VLHKVPLHPFEWVTLAAVTATTLLLGASGTPASVASMRYTLGAMARVLPMALVLGVLLHGCYCWSQGGPLRPYLRQLLTPAWLLLWIRLWLACWIVSFCYFWVKVYVPLIHEGTWDGALWEADRWMHLGFSPNEVAVALLAGSPLAGLLDTWYSLWLASVVWSLAFFAASDDSLLRRRIVLSCLLLWICGATLYLTIPARGPIFVFERTWADLAGSLSHAEQAQMLLRNNYEAMLATRAGDVRPFDHRLGVAALPSLHVGFHALFTFWAWRKARGLRFLFLGMTLLTFIGSVLTGWHYAVDGYVGLAVAYLCYRAALWLERGISATEVETEPSAD
jgi:hypothetical protein